MMNDFMKTKWFGLLVIMVEASLIGVAIYAALLYAPLLYAPLAGMVSFGLQIVGAWTIGSLIGDVVGDKVAAWQKTL